MSGMEGADAVNDAAVDARIAAYMVFGDPREQPDVRDHVRHPRPAGDPPVPEAQWNELAGQWERWDVSTHAWVLVGEPGPGVDVYWDDEPEPPPVAEGSPSS
jgi:hypothetical protein